MHLDGRLSLVVLAFSRSHPNTRQDDPSQEYGCTSGRQCLVSRYISQVALYQTSAHPDGSPADQDGWCLSPLRHLYMPFHSIYSTNLSFLSPICYFAWAAMCFMYAHVSACGHTCDSMTPARSSSWAATLTCTQGTSSLLQQFVSFSIFLSDAS